MPDMPVFCARCNGSWSSYDPDPFPEFNGKRYHARCLPIYDSVRQYQEQSRWRRFLHHFGVATYVDGEGGCIYCGGWH